MNKAFVVILVFLSLININCSTDDPTQPSTSPSYSVSGKIFEIFNGDSLTVSNAIVSIGAVSDTTDSAGTFIIKGIDKGDHVLAARYMFENQIRTVENPVTVSSDTTLFIELEPIKLDFFPLMVGYQWVYDYTHERIVSPNAQYLYITGCRILSVIENMSVQDSASYRIQDVFFGTSILLDLWTGISDTMVIEADTTYFNLSMNQDDIITITSHDPLPDYYKQTSHIRYDDFFRLWDPIQFSRFEPSSATEPIEYYGDTGLGVCFLTLERDTGITKYEYNVIANHGVYSTLMLREAILNKRSIYP